jgi:hypothetical protein
MSSWRKRASIVIKRLVLTSLAIVLFGVGCGRKLEPEDGCNFVQNGQMQRVSWKAQLPIELYIDQSVPKEYYESIQSAMAQWEDKLKRPVFRIVGTVADADANGKKDERNVIYYSPDWDGDKPNEQGRTTIYWLGDIIYEADIRLNGSGTFSFFNGPAAVPTGKVDMESLVLHELGHVLGLQHNDQVPSVMATSLESGFKRREPKPADLASLKCEYGG